MLASTVQQSASTVRIHISPLLFSSFPFRHHRALWTLCYPASSHQLSDTYTSINGVYAVPTQSPKFIPSPLSLVSIPRKFYSPTSYVYFCFVNKVTYMDFFQILHISVLVCFSQKESKMGKHANFKTHRGKASLLVVLRVTQ